MGPENQEGTKRGRPPKGSTTMTNEIKIRLEPGLIQRLEAASRTMQRTKVDIIRDAIRMYLNKVEEVIGQNYY